MNPIELAVMPLKIEAENYAEQYAVKEVKRVSEALEKSGYDLRVAAPHPSCIGKNALYGNAYHAALAEYTLFRKIVKSRVGSRAYHEPDYADLNAELVQKFISDVRKMAAEQYEAFVAKLVRKIGAVETATLQGNHVWSYSILVVKKTGGIVEFWKTRQIVNVSKLGKYFAQWPSRKAKSGEVIV